MRRSGAGILSVADLVRRQLGRPRRCRRCGRRAGAPTRRRSGPVVPLLTHYPVSETPIDLPEACGCCGVVFEACTFELDLPDSLPAAVANSDCDGVTDGPIQLDYVGQTVQGSITSHTYAAEFPFACATTPNCQYVVYHVGHDSSLNGVWQRFTLTDDLVPDYSTVTSGCEAVLSSPSFTACPGTQTELEAALFFNIPGAGFSGSFNDPDLSACCTVSPQDFEVVF